MLLVVSPSLVAVPYKVLISPPESTETLTNASRPRPVELSSMLLDPWRAETPVWSLAALIWVTISAWVSPLLKVMVAVPKVPAMATSVEPEVRAVPPAYANVAEAT